MGCSSFLACGDGNKWTMGCATAKEMYICCVWCLGKIGSSSSSSRATKDAFAEDPHVAKPDRGLRCGQSGLKCSDKRPADVTQGDAVRKGIDCVAKLFADANGLGS